MRRIEKQVFDMDVLHRVINNANICRIGLVKGDSPYVIPYITVIVHGTAELTIDQDEKRYGLAQIVSHYRASEEEYQFNEEELKPVLVYKISIKEIVGKMSGLETTLHVPETHLGPGTT